MKRLLTIITFFCLTVGYCFSIDPPKIKLGVGGGVNFSKIGDKNSYPLVDNTSASQYSSEYSKMFSNFGSQFFIHGECVFNDFILALKPGLYTFNFDKTDEVLNSGINSVESNYRLRYLNTPLEAKWLLGMGNIRPYIGWEFSYGYLLQQGGDANNAFKRSRFSTGPTFGYFFKLQSFNIVFSSGYDLGLNVIADNDNSVSGSAPFTPTNIKLHNLYFSLSILFNAEKSDFRKSLDCPKIQRQ